jgi:large subunit ribosomal protein L17
MRHARHGKKLGRDAAHRKALYSNLAGALIEHGRIKTTVTKAKAVKPIAEQMITLGRRGDIHARRQATAFLRSKAVVHRLFTEVAPAFADRPGGYARIVKLGPRPGDAAEMVYLELVGDPLVFKTKLSDVAAADDKTDAVADAEEPEVEGDTAVEDEVAAEEPDDDEDAPDGEEPSDVAEVPDGEPSDDAQS